jgi:hypothetical protein
MTLIPTPSLEITRMPTQPATPLRPPVEDSWPLIAKPEDDDESEGEGEGE